MWAWISTLTEFTVKGNRNYNVVFPIRTAMSVNWSDNSCDPNLLCSTVCTGCDHTLRQQKYVLKLFFLLLKVLPHCITFACWDSGCPLAGVVTPYLVLDTGLIAYITPDLTGGVVAVKCYWMAAVQTTCADVGVIQNWTSYSWGRIKKIGEKKLFLIGSVKAGKLCTYKLVLEEYGQIFRNH